MQDFAYIYLAFDHDCDRASQTVATPILIPSSWAAPIDHSAHSGSPSSHPEASISQEADLDLEVYSYPSFYL